MEYEVGHIVRYRLDFGLAAGATVDYIGQIILILNGIGLSTSGHSVPNGPGTLYVVKKLYPYDKNGSREIQLMLSDIKELVPEAEAKEYLINELKREINGV